MDRTADWGRGTSAAASRAKAPEERGYGLAMAVLAIFGASYNPVMPSGQAVAAARLFLKDWDGSPGGGHGAYDYRERLLDHARPAIQSPDAVEVKVCRCGETWKSASSQCPIGHAGQYELVTFTKPGDTT